MKRRCMFTECKKKLKIMEEFECKCSLFFCNKHRYSDIHNCSYDIKFEWKLKLKTNNPVVIADKFNKIKN